jgi:hypothetical protein
MVAMTLAIGTGPAGRRRRERLLLRPDAGGLELFDDVLAGLGEGRSARRAGPEPDLALQVGPRASAVERRSRRPLRGDLRRRLGAGSDRYRQCQCRAERNQDGASTQHVQLRFVRGT